MSSCNSSYKMDTDFVIESFTWAVHADMFCWHFELLESMRFLFNGRLTQYSYSKWWLKAMQNEKKSIGPVV